MQGKVGAASLEVSDLIDILLGGRHGELSQTLSQASSHLSVIEPLISPPSHISQLTHVVSCDPFHRRFVSSFSAIAYALLPLNPLSSNLQLLRRPSALVVELNMPCATMPHYRALAGIRGPKAPFLLPWLHYRLWRAYNIPCPSSMFSFGPCVLSSAVVAFSRPSPKKVWAATISSMYCCTLWNTPFVQMPHA